MKHYLVKTDFNTLTGVGVSGLAVMSAKKYKKLTKVIDAYFLSLEDDEIFEIEADGEYVHIDSLGALNVATTIRLIDRNTANTLKNTIGNDYGPMTYWDIYDEVIRSQENEQ